MNEAATFGQALTVASTAVIEMTLIALLGFLFVKRAWLNKKSVAGLNRLLIDGVTPCALFIAMVRGFSPEVVSQSWPLVLVSTVWMLASIGGCLLLFRKWGPSNTETDAHDRAVAAMTGVQNSIFLPLPVALAVTTTLFHDEVTVTVGLVVIPTMLLQWTIGVRLLAAREPRNRKKQLLLLFNAPLLGAMFGALLSFVPGLSTAANGQATAWVGWQVLFGAMELISQALSPLAMIVLGAFIASSSLRGLVRARHVIPLIGVRLLIVPAAVFGILVAGWFSLPPVAAMVLVLEAASPPATSHALIAQRYGGPWQLVSSLLLVVHIVALITLPFWLAMALHHF